MKDRWGKMGKYWKLIVALAVMLLGISSYYGHAAYVTGALPEFIVKTVEGDEKYMDGITASSVFMTDQSYEYLQITKEGSVYRDQESILKQLKGVPFSYERDLRDRYSSLLRGSFWGTSVYEDERYVVVAGDTYDYYNDETKIEVRQLDKATRKTKKMTHLLKGQNNRVMIDDVQMAGDDVVLITRNLIRYADSLSTIEAYTFNIAEQKLVDHTVLLEAPAHEYELWSLGESVHWHPKEYYAMRKTPASHFDHTVQPNEVVTEEAEGKLEEEASELYVYEIATGNVDLITLPEELSGKSANLYDGSNLYFVNHLPYEIEITVFSIAAGEIINTLTLPYDGPAEYDANPPNLTVYDGYIYVMEATGNEKNPATITVVDIEADDVVCKAHIVPKKDAGGNETYEVDMYNLVFRYK